MQGDARLDPSRILLRQRKIVLPPPSAAWFPFSEFGQGIRHNTGFLVRAPRCGSFRVKLSPAVIEWQPAARPFLPAWRRLLQLLVLYLKPRLLLHASAVFAGKGICFMARSGTGKSTLGAFFSRRKFLLLTDDITVIQKKNGRFFIRPILPVAHLGKDSARSVLGVRNGAKLRTSRAGVRGKRLYPVGETLEGAAAPEIPLERIYLLERTKNASIRIESLSVKQSLRTLTRHSVRLLIQDPSGFQRQFVLTVELLRRVPVKRLSYPSGFSHLPKVCDAVLKDLSNSSGFKKAT